MALFPRMSAIAPMRHEYGPFFNLFNDTFNELQRISDAFPAQTTFMPKFDVRETNDAYNLEGELPGIQQKDLTIEFADEHTLTIKGRTEHTREEGQPPAADGAKPAATDAAPASENTEVAKVGSQEVARPQESTYWVSERSVGEFARSFNFANRVDQDNVKASLKNGILSIVVPKLAKKDTSRRITVESE